MHILLKRNSNITNNANLVVELQQLWNVCSVETVPIINGACDVILKKFEKLICEELDIKINTNKMQRCLIRHCKLF